MIDRCHAVVVLVFALGCESIAGVEDVSYKGGPLGSDPALCADYCGMVAKACPGDLAVYEDKDACMRVCALTPPGSDDAPSGNTIACRMMQADHALQLDSAVEKRGHCPAAGPSGGATCTDYAKLPGCEGYCSLLMAACGHAAMGFDTLAECTAKCGAVPPGPDYTVTSAIASGNTLSCRLYYAVLATADPKANCETAGLRPLNACLGGDEPPSCDDYCRAVEVACTEDLRVYESVKQCKAVCNEMPKGSRDDSGSTPQDTLGCRNWQTFYALTIDPIMHCPRSGPTGDGVCSEAEEPNCKPYCRLALKGCPDAFAQTYGDDATCLAECEKLDDADVENMYNVEAAQRGHTLKCRTLYAARAVTDPAIAAEACPGAMGEAPCD